MTEGIVPCPLPRAVFWKPATSPSSCPYPSCFEGGAVAIYQLSPRPPYDACDRNYHFIRRFASVQANLSAALQLFFVFVACRRPPLIVIAVTLPPFRPNVRGAYQKNRYGKRENPYTRLRERKTRIIRTIHRDPSCVFFPLCFRFLLIKLKGNSDIFQPV